MLVGGRLYSCFTVAVGNFWLAWGCLVGTKTHMGFLLRQYRCPLATRVVNEKGSRVARPQSKKCQLVDFRRKRKVCGATSGAKVPTRGFSAKKETVWRDLPAIFHSRNFAEKGSRVARCPQREKHNKMSLKCVYKQLQ